MSKMDSIEITGISVDEAVKEALEQLGAQEAEVSVEVLVTPRVGVLGLGTRYAKVRVTRKSAQAAANAQKSPTPRSERASDGRPRGRENQRRGRIEGLAQSQSPQAPAASDDDSGASGRKSADVEEQRREAMAILKQILEQMGEPTEVRQIEVDAETVEIEIK